MLSLASDRPLRSDFSEQIRGYAPHLVNDTPYDYKDEMNLLDDNFGRCLASAINILELQSLVIDDESEAHVSETKSEQSIA